MDRRGLLIGGALSAAAVTLDGPAASAGPAIEEYPEHRTAAQLRADSAYAARQVEALASSDDRILDRLGARQETATGGLPFDRYRSAGSGTEVLVARGQIVVGPDSRVVPQARLVHSAKGPAQLAREVARLRAGGIDAGMNLVVPLGYVVKAQDYPWVTQGPGPAPATGQARVRVALVDTGIGGKRRTDGWLDGVAVGPANTDPLDVVAPAGRLDWGSGHGTFTAGIVRRVAPQCEIVMYRFTRTDGLGTDRDVADLLLRAAADGHQAGVRTIINASLGTPAVDGAPPVAMRAALDHISANYPDVLVVAAAGNMGSAEAIYPAAFGGVVAVGALMDDLSPAPFSSRGPWLTCSTVGVGVVSTFVPGVSPPEPDPSHPDQVFGADAWAMWSGTSFSAPQVSGTVARLCAENPELKTRPALARLLAGRPQLPGYGRVLRVLPGTPV
jgi:thermitase